MSCLLILAERMGQYDPGIIEQFELALKKWGVHNFFGQPASVSYRLHSQNFFLASYLVKETSLSNFSSTRTPKSFSTVLLLMVSFPTLCSHLGLP